MYLEILYCNCVFKYVYNFLKNYLKLILHSVLYCIIRGIGFAGQAAMRWSGEVSASASIKTCFLGLTIRQEVTLHI